MDFKRPTILLLIASAISLTALMGKPETKSDVPPPSPTPSGNRITSKDLVWLGAFHFPKEAPLIGGGYSLTYCPTCNGGKGSLFIQSSVNDKAFAEYTIPAPVKTTDPSTMNTATQLQNWTDITGGLGKTVWDPNGATGVQYVPARDGQATAKLCFLPYNYYFVDGKDRDSLGCSNTTFRELDPHGLWHIGDFHAIGTSQYMMEIPSDWQSNVDGEFLAVGRHRTNGNKGPSLYSVKPWSNNGWPKPGKELPAHVLLTYNQEPEGYNWVGKQGKQVYPDYTACDDWSGGAWITGSKTGVLFLGSKGMGPVTYGSAGRVFGVKDFQGTFSQNYANDKFDKVTGQTSGATGVIYYPIPGYHSPADPKTVHILFIQGTFQSGEVVQKDANNRFTLTDVGKPDLDQGSQGWHCEPMQVQLIFYDPSDLVPGARKHGTVIPYEIAAFPDPPGQVFNGDHLYRTGGVAYDRIGKRLFFVSALADYVGGRTGQPVVHVFSVP